MGSFSLHLNSPVLKHWQKIARVLGYPDLGIRKVFARGIRNPGHRNQEFSTRTLPERLESRFQLSLTWNPELTAWNPKSKTLKTVLNNLTWGNRINSRLSF